MIEPWMITLGLLVPFIVNLAKLSVTGGFASAADDAVVEHDDDDDDAKGGEKVRVHNYTTRASTLT